MPPGVGLVVIKCEKMREHAVLAEVVFSKDF